MTTNRILIVAAPIAIAIGLVLLIPPFILPESVYDAIYGWRYPKKWVAGEAEIIDHGPNTANGRYTIGVEFQPHTGEFRRELHLARLPREEFTVGLLIPLETHGSWKTEWDALRNTVLEITVTEQSGDLVASHKGQMGGDWTWSGPYRDNSFVYCRDTQFLSGPAQRYKLSISINTSIALPKKSKLHLRAGGWK